MQELDGLYTNCIIYSNIVEETAILQLKNIINNIAFKDLKLRIMPDVHSGVGSVIGFTSTLGDKIIPNVIGVDIGCGVNSICLGDIAIDFEILDQVIRAKIPSGFNLRTAKVEKSLWYKSCPRLDFLPSIEKICNIINIDFQKVKYSVGTLGGGNHFIEIGVDEENRKWLTVHTGSRHFGKCIADFHQKIANTKNPNGALSYLENEDKEYYFEHLKIAQEYATYNRALICNTILQEMNWNALYTIESIHNYIDFSDNIIRKGAISANLGQYVVIPLNMKDGILIGKGKGNPDWNNSAPHGAGRILSRGVAKKTLNIEDYKNIMNGVWSSCVTHDTIDESPMVYKNPEDLLSDPTIDIVNRIKSVYNFKHVSKDN